MTASRGTADLQGSIDELLAGMVIEARVTFRGLACTRWGITGGPAGRVGFHAVLSGECWVRTRMSETPTRATAGGLLLYRPNNAHLLADSPEVSEPQPPVRLAPLSSEHLGKNVGLLCGYFEAGTANAALVNTLPECLFWPSAAASPAPVAALLKVLDVCAHTSDSPEFLLERLLEVLIVMILRTVTGARPPQLGILRAQQHPQLRRVLTALHRRPDRPWTVRSMASVIGLSRSVFAELFHKEVGESPARYLQNYRLALAARLQRRGNISPEELARRCGYRSTAAFRRRLRRSTSEQT